MRRVMSVILTAVILLSMTVCAGERPKVTAPLSTDAPQAAAGEIDPAISVREDGEGVKRAFRMFPYYWLSDDAFMVRQCAGSGAATIWRPMKRSWRSLPMPCAKLIRRSSWG